MQLYGDSILIKEDQNDVITCQDDKNTSYLNRLHTFARPI